MRMNALIHLAVLHARATGAGLLLLGFVMLLASFPPLVGLQVADFLSRAVTSQVDQLDARRVTIERRELHSPPSIDDEAIRRFAALDGVAHAQALIEIGVKVSTTESPSGRMTIAESTTPEDPRFVPERMVAPVRARAPSGGAIVARGLLVAMPDPATVSIRVIRRRGEIVEELPLELPVAGVSAMEGERLYLPLELAAALDAWASGKAPVADMRGERVPAPNAAQVPAQHRAMLFANDVEAVGPLVAELEEAGWRTRHRLRDVQAVARTRALIYGVTGLAAGGFVAAGLVASGVYIAASHRSNRRTAAGLRLCAVDGRDATMLVLAPVVFTATACFALSLGVSVALGPSACRWIASALGLPPGAPAGYVPGGRAVLVAILTLAPVVLGSVVSFQRSWRLPVTVALRPAA